MFYLPTSQQQSSLPITRPLWWHSEIHIADPGPGFDNTYVLIAAATLLDNELPGIQTYRAAQAILGHVHEIGIRAGRRPD